MDVIPIFFRNKQMSTSEVKNEGWSTPASIKETFGKEGIKIRNTPGILFYFLLLKLRIYRWCW